MFAPFQQRSDVTSKEYLFSHDYSGGVVVQRRTQVFNVRTGLADGTARTKDLAHHLSIAAERRQYQNSFGHRSSFLPAAKPI